MSEGAVFKAGILGYRAFNTGEIVSLPVGGDGASVTYRLAAEGRYSLLRPSGRRDHWHSWVAMQDHDAAAPKTVCLAFLPALGLCVARHVGQDAMPSYAAPFDALIGRITALTTHDGELAALSDSPNAISVTEAKAWIDNGEDQKGVAGVYPHSTVYIHETFIEVPEEIQATYPKDLFFRAQPLNARPEQLRRSDLTRPIYANDNGNRLYSFYIPLGSASSCACGHVWIGPACTLRDDEGYFSNCPGCKAGAQQSLTHLPTSR